MKICQTTDVETVISSMPEEIAPPRKNGEIVFQEPWEGRTFGMTLALYQSKNFSSWDDFRSRLIEEIAIWEKENPEAKEDDPDWNYYQQWVKALERLVVETGMLDEKDIDERAYQFIAGEREDVAY